MIGCGFLWLSISKTNRVIPNYLYMAEPIFFLSNYRIDNYSCMIHRVEHKLNPFSCNKKFHFSFSHTRGMSTPAVTQLPFDTRFAIIISHNKYTNTRNPFGAHTFTLDFKQNNLRQMKLKLERVEIVCFGSKANMISLLTFSVGFSAA